MLTSKEAKYFLENFGVFKVANFYEIRRYGALGQHVLFVVLYITGQN